MAKQREVIWTAGARTDLDEIVAYIAKDSPTAAIAFLEEVLTTAEGLMTLEADPGSLSAVWGIDGESCTNSAASRGSAGVDSRLRRRKSRRKEVHRF